MLARLGREERGAVAIVTAAQLVVLLGIGAFVLDFGRAYLVQSQDQRAADAAAVAAAMAYGSTSSASTAATEACVIAKVNGVNVTCSPGIDTTKIQTTIVASPKNAADAAAKVVIATPVPLDSLAAVFEPAGTTINVGAQAWAQINTGTGPCLIALQPSGSGITQSGSAATQAPNCDVESGGPITLSGGAGMTAKDVYAAGAISSSGGSTYTVSGTKAASYSFKPGPGPADPFASSAMVTTGFPRLTTVSAYTSPSIGSAPTGGSAWPSSCGGTVATGNYTNLTFSGAGCTYTVNAPITVSGTLKLSANNVTVNFVGSGTNKIGAIQGGGTGQLIKASGNTFDIYGAVSSGSGDLSIGCSSTAANGGCSSSDADTNTYNILGGVSSAGAGLAFGNGDFDIAGGVKTSGGKWNNTPPSSCADTDTFVQFGNGTNFIVTDTGIAISGGCLITGSDTNHDINSGTSNGNGVAVSAGGAQFGAGTYTIYGKVSFSGTSISTGSGITLVLSGDLAMSGSTSPVTWSAPTSGTYSAPPFVVATNTSDNNGIQLSGGTSGTIVNGAVYVPNAPVSLSGSGAISGGTASGACFELVAWQKIDLSGSSAANPVTASSCWNGGSVSSGTVALVQ